MLSLQALGGSCHNLVYVASLVNLIGYATYKKIKNDHLSIPVTQYQTGKNLGLVKKVRLTVKMRRAENFDEIIEKENASNNFHKEAPTTTPAKKSQPPLSSEKSLKASIQSTTKPSSEVVVESQPNFD